MINSNLRCKDNTFSDNINTFTKIIKKKCRICIKIAQVSDFRINKKNEKSKKRKRSAVFLHSFIRIIQYRLPEGQTLLLGDIHLVAGLHTEGLVPGIDMRQGTIHTPAAQ